MKKSYKGFILWIVLFMAGFFPIMLIKTNAGLLTRITMNYTSMMLAFLAYIIYKYDRIYWYNGVDFEEAAEAGRERRDAYTVAHLKKFIKFAGFYALFSFIMHLAGKGIWIDSIVFTLGLICTAVSTIRIKL
ncbi:MAG: hypothetical protein IJ410_03600 [Oscillospiraceae bacterium]|nr:hypothetical protein [Oscillospiraceae bacterium]